MESSVWAVYEQCDIVGNVIVCSVSVGSVGILWNTKYSTMWQYEQKRHCRQQCEHWTVRAVWTVWTVWQQGQAQFPEDSGLKGSGQQSTDTFATKEREVNTIEAFLKPTSQAVCNVYNF